MVCFLTQSDQTQISHAAFLQQYPIVARGPRRLCHNILTSTNLMLRTLWFLNFCKFVIISLQCISVISIVIGRNTSSSECDKYYLIPGNNTFNLSSDGYQIDPPCSLYFLGFGKTDKKTGLTGMCYDVVDIDLACGYGNMFTIRPWSLVVRQNGSDSYLTVNKTVVSFIFYFRRLIKVQKIM